MKCVGVLYLSGFIAQTISLTVNYFVVFRSLFSVCENCCGLCLTAGEDLVLADAQVLTINFSLGPPTEGVVFISRPDKVTENEECLVVELSVNEEELDDERDRGQVNFDRNVALVRLRDPIVGNPLLHTMCFLLFVEAVCSMTFTSLII